MGAFGGLLLTNTGRNLQAKGQTGVQLKFTRIALGDGNLDGQNVADLNRLINEKLTLPISKLKTQPGGKAVVGTVLRNADLTAGFYFREIGVFAQDPDIGEVLYCYGNCGPTAEYIPAGSSPDVIEKTIDIITIIGNAINVTATIDESLVWETPAGAQAKVDIHANNTVMHVTQADKDRWNALPNTPLATTGPAELKIAGKAVIGTASTAARADHEHPMPGLATPTVSGFMDAVDKDTLQSLRKYRSSKDATIGIYTVVEYKRKDGTLFMKSVLSNKVGDNYLVDTRTFYATNGTTIRKTEVWDLTYDSDGDIVNEVLRS